MVTWQTWAEWQQREPPRLHQNHLYDFLRDSQRVQGAGVRAWQYLVLPSHSSPMLAYDLYAEPSVMLRLMNPPQPQKVTLVRCRIAQWWQNDPSCEYHSATVPLALFHQLLADLQALPMPPIFAPLIDTRGNDGAEYEFALHSPFEIGIAPVVTYVRYHWWSDPPPDLLPLQAYCRQAVQVLEGLLG